MKRVLILALLLSACSAMNTMRDMTDTYVEGDRLFISGTLNAQTYDEITGVLAANPQLTTVVLEHIDGSIDDEYNLKTGLMIHEAGLNTYLPADGFIESGAVDIFCAGRERIYERGGHVGVHSWGFENGERGDEIPKDHEFHKQYVDYFKKVGCPVEFYWFTLETAGPDDMHRMSEPELRQYNVATRFVAPVE